MVGLIIVQLLLLVLQLIALLRYDQTGDKFWFLISNVFFAGVIGVMVHILMTYGLV